MPWNTEEEEVV